jgi:hypothetical protein
VAFVPEPKDSGRARAGDDGDFVESVFAIQVGQGGALFYFGRAFLEHISTIGAIHEQPNYLRVGEKRTAVGMIRAHYNAPRIFDQQIPFQADRPLERMDERVVAVLNRRDPAARFHFRVAAEPFSFEDV